MHHPARRILPAIVISQFFCTSLWFAGNAVISDIARQFHLPPEYLAHLASIVQFGFIAGTLVFAVFSISDRFSPSSVFFTCAMIAAAINLGACIGGISVQQLMLLRFFTGFFIAGIYPIGMKLAADHYQQGLGRSLGFLVGALVLGSAFPHLLKFAMMALPWKYVFFSTSALSVIGGLGILLLVPNGPYRHAGSKGSFTTFFSGFKNREFTVVAMGYFGHMWELYALWVFTPVILSAYKSHYPGASFDVSLMSFLLIASGSIACAAGGIISQRLGVRRTATISLAISCGCCLISPLLLFSGSAAVLFIFLFIWSMAVIADSPMFSTLVANAAPKEARGTSLTAVTCGGFAITIASIQLISALKTDANAGYVYMLLAIGPVLGLTGLVATPPPSLKDRDI